MDVESTGGVPQGDALDEVEARLAAMDARVDAVHRDIQNMALEQRERLIFLRKRAGWILLWSVLGLGSCTAYQSHGDDATQLQEINTKVSSLVDRPDVSTDGAKHDEVMELCHLLGQVGAREQVVPTAISTDVVTDCITQAKAGYDEVAKAGPKR